MKRISFLCALLLLGSVSAWGEMVVTSGQLTDPVDPNFGTKYFQYDFWTASSGSAVLNPVFSAWDGWFRNDGSVNVKAGVETNAGMVAAISTGSQYTKNVCLMKFNFEGTGYAVQKLWMTAMHANFNTNLLPAGVSIVLLCEYSTNKGATWQQFPHVTGEHARWGFNWRQIVDSTPDVCEWGATTTLNVAPYHAATNYQPYALPKGATNFWLRYTMTRSDGLGITRSDWGHLFRWNANTTGGFPSQGLHMKFGLNPVKVAIGETDGGTSVAEQGPTSDTYTLVLTQAQTADVTIALTVKDPNALRPAGMTASPASVTFTAANWNVPQTITLTAIDDADREGVWHSGLVEHAVSSADAGFQGTFVADLGVQIRDNDTPEIQVVTASPFEVREQGATSTTMTVAFNVAPAGGASATVALALDATQGTLSTNSLTFTAANYNVPQTVTITAVDDAVQETYQRTFPVTLTTTSTDPWFNNLAAVNAAPVLNVYDNECGSWGRSAYDANGDCHIDLLDFAAFSQNWMACTTPEIVGCVKLN